MLHHQLHNQTHVSIMRQIWSLELVLRLQGVLWANSVPFGNDNTKCVAIRDLVKCFAISNTKITTVGNITMYILNVSKH